jgi:hypothetical protein
MTISSGFLLPTLCREIKTGHMKQPDKNRPETDAVTEIKAAGTGAAG